MVGKLFRYDMEALSKILVPVHIAAVALGIMACIGGMVGEGISSTHAYLTAATSSALYVLLDAITSFAAFVVVLSVVALMCAVAATGVVVIVRFYKNLFTDEGYLTLTLPVPSWMHVASKLLSGIAWMLIDAVIVGVCLVAVSVAMYGITNVTVSDLMPYWMLSVLAGDWGGDLGLLGVASGALIYLRGVVQAQLVAFAAFALGAAVASRHKVAAGIGFMLLINWLISLLWGFAMAILYVAFDFGTWYADLYDVMFGAFGWVVFIVVSVACWFVTVYVLDRKVNLA